MYKLEAIPGTKVIEFASFEDDKLITLSDNGILSCFNFKKNNPSKRLLHQLSLFTEENEVAECLALNASLNKICIISFVHFPKPDNKEGDTSNKKETININLHVLEFDFMDQEFVRVYGKAVQLATGIEVPRLKVKLALEHQVNGLPLLVMLLGIPESELIAILLTERAPAEYSILNIGKPAVDFSFAGREVWFLNKNGDIDCFV